MTTDGRRIHNLTQRVLRFTGDNRNARLTCECGQEVVLVPGRVETCGGCTREYLITINLRVKEPVGWLFPSEIALGKVWEDSRLRRERNDLKARLAANQKELFHEAAACVDWWGRCQEAEAERDMLRARLEEVEADRDSLRAEVDKLPSEELRDA